jgi:hypothetical protein
MDNPMNFGAMIDAARAENEHGIVMRGKKRYTSVAVRVEIMRRHAGALSVSTEIVHWSPDKGAAIVVKATVADNTGRVLATGHAEEIRGAGQVNSTSALENAETSAIGRALAALGLAGGEFASANELDAVARKDAAPPPDDAPAPDISAAIDMLNASETVEGLAAIWKMLPKDAKNDIRVQSAKDNRKHRLADITPPF